MTLLLVKTCINCLSENERIKNKPVSPARGARSHLLS